MITLIELQKNILNCVNPEIVYSVLAKRCLALLLLNTDPDPISTVGNTILY